MFFYSIWISYYAAIYSAKIINQNISPLVKFYYSAKLYKKIKYWNMLRRGLSTNISFLTGRNVNYFTFSGDFKIVKSLISRRKFGDYLGLGYQNTNKKRWQFSLIDSTRLLSRKRGKFCGLQYFILPPSKFRGRTISFDYDFSINCNNNEIPALPALFASYINFNPDGTISSEYYCLPGLKTKRLSLEMRYDNHGEISAAELTFADSDGGCSGARFGFGENNFLDRFDAPSSYSLEFCKKFNLKYEGIKTFPSSIKFYESGYVEKITYNYNYFAPHDKFMNNYFNTFQTIITYAPGTPDINSLENNSYSRRYKIPKLNKPNDFETLKKISYRDLSEFFDSLTRRHSGIVINTVFMYNGRQI